MPEPAANADSPAVDPIPEDFTDVNEYFLSLIHIYFQKRFGYTLERTVENKPYREKFITQEEIERINEDVYKRQPSPCEKETSSSTARKTPWTPSRWKEEA